MQRPRSTQAGVGCRAGFTVPDFDICLQQKVLDLIGTLEEGETTGAVIRDRSLRF